MRFNAVLLNWLKHQGEMDMHCLIVDDHPVTLFGIRWLIKTNFPDWKISIAMSIHEANECINATNGHAIDMVLLDLLLEDENGVTFISKLRQNSSTRGIATIVISGIDDEDTIALCKKLGARGYVPKSSGMNQILRVVQAVSVGDEYFYRCDGDKACVSQSNLPTLTSRQHDLLDLLLEGHSNKTIADMLNLRYGTVKNYMFDLMRLLSVRSRLELVAKVRGSGYQIRHDMHPEVMQSPESEQKIAPLPLLPTQVSNASNGG